MSELEQKEPIDLNLWIRQREVVQGLCKEVQQGTAESPTPLAVQSAKLHDMTTEVMDALLNDMGYLHQVLKMTQMQMSNIAQQSYLALEVLKREGITSDEKIHELHESMMQQHVEQAAADTAESADVQVDLDPEQTREFMALLSQGFSEAEARSIVWPEGKDPSDTENTAKVLQFPGA